MANKQTLPNQSDVRGSYINTQGAPQLPSINYKSPLRDVAGVIDYSNQFLGTYTKLRNEQYEAQGVGLMNRMAHEMEDAADPCQLQEIKNAYDQQLNEIGGNDYWAKNYRNSRYFQNFKNKWDLNTEKLYLNKMHDFENIAAVAAGQEIANTLAYAQSPEDVQMALQSYNKSLAGIQHLTAEHKYKLLSNMIGNSMGNVVANNPQVAEAFINQYGQEWGRFGLDTTDVTNKIESRKRALRAEARAEEAHQRRLVKEAREAKEDQLKAQIIKNPENADQLIAEAATIDDKLFVNISDWYRKGLGKQKASTQSPYVEGFINAENKDEYVQENLEAIGDSKYRSAVNFYYNKINKKANTDEDKAREKELLNEMKEAASKGKEDYETYIDGNFAEIAKYSQTRSMQSSLDKRFGIKQENYVDTYLADINSMDFDSVDDIKAERVRLSKNTLLSDADKNKVYKTLSTIESKLNSANEKAERKADKEAAAEVKEQEKVAKEESAQALNEVYSQVPNGAESVNEAYLNNLSKMNTADRGKAIKQINTLIKEEAKGDAKAQNEARKQQQAKNYMALNNQIINGTLNDPNVIEQAANDGLITPQNAVKLENKLHELNVKQSKADEKSLIDQDKLLIYSNAEKGIVTPVDDLKSGNAEVRRQRDIMANRTTEKNYKKRLAEITSEIYDNLPDEKTQRGYVNDLTRLNDGTHTPEQDVQKVISQVSNSDFDKFRNLKTKLFAFMGAPLSGKNYSAYEMELRNSALDEAYNFAKDKGRAPTTEELSQIAGKYMPTKVGFNQYRDTRDSAYFNLLSERNSLFEPVKFKTDENGAKVATYRLNKSYKFTDFDNYTQRLEQARDKISDSDYKELYKPVALYMGDILRRAQTEDSIEAYAMRSLLQKKYSNRIEDPVAIYEDYRKLMGILEAGGAVRTKETAFFFGTTKGDVDEAINKMFKNSQQIQGNGVRN